jgi:transposase
MNSEKIFELALGLTSPWVVNEIKLVEDKKRKELHIHIGYESSDMFKTKEGKSLIYDHMDRSWRHLKFFEHECYIHCRVPRVLDKANKPKQVSVPWAREGSGFTLLFEAFSMCLIEREMPTNKVGDILSVLPNRIRTIFNYWIGIAYSEADHSNITKLGIDETSSKKGHDYVTIAVDMDKRRTVFATKGKDAKTIEKIADYLDEKGSPRERIEQVCIDLSPSFISGTMSQFKNASIVFDRFHVKQLLNKAMDDLRKQEYRQHAILKGHKYTFLKSNEKLTSRQIKEANDLITLLPNIGEAYRLKLLFDDFWEMKDEQEAQGFLAYWSDLVYESKIQPFIKFVATLNAHWRGIVNYTKFKISNGILESINSKVQLAKKRARGYANTDNFIHMIYFLTGKLNYNYPKYLT